MATINISVPTNIMKKVFNSIKTLQGQTVSMATIAAHSGVSLSNVRYSIDDLVDSGYVEKVATKNFNNHYKRFSYSVLKEFKED